MNEASLTCLFFVQLTTQSRKNIQFFPTWKRYKIEKMEHGYILGLISFLWINLTNNNSWFECVQRCVVFLESVPSVSVFSVFSHSGICVVSLFLPSFLSFPPSVTISCLSLPLRLSVHPCRAPVMLECEAIDMNTSLHPRTVQGHVHFDF